MIKIIPNKKDIGAEIECDLKKISNQDLKKIKQALYKYGVIFFRKQILTSSSYIKFAKNFGKLAKYPRLKGLSKKYLFVGRLSKEKGVLQLARACKKLDLDITFVGDGDCRDEIHQIYPRAKITGWINSQDEIDNYIRHSRMVIFPSLWYETFGLVVLDSMKNGVPAIVSSHSTASEFIKHKFNGLLFDTSVSGTG